MTPRTSTLLPSLVGLLPAVTPPASFAPAPEAMTHIRGRGGAGPLCWRGSPPRARAVTRAIAKIRAVMSVNESSLAAQRERRGSPRATDGTLPSNVEIGGPPRALSRPKYFRGLPRRRLASRHARAVYFWAHSSAQRLVSPLAYRSPHWVNLFGSPMRSWRCARRRSARYCTAATVGHRRRYETHFRRIFGLFANILNGTLSFLRDARVTANVNVADAGQVESASPLRWAGDARVKTKGLLNVISLAMTDAERTVFQRASRVRRSTIRRSTRARGKKPRGSWIPIGIAGRTRHSPGKQS